MTPQNRNKTTKMLAAVMVAFLIGVLVLGSSAPALAQATTTATPAATTPKAKKDLGAPIRATLKAITNAMATETGLTEPEIFKELLTGKTLNDIITAKQGDPAKVKDAAKKALTAEIAAAVTSGKSTQAQADKMLAQLDTVLDKAFSTDLREQIATLMKNKSDGLTEKLFGKVGGYDVLVQETAKATNLSQRDVVQKLRDGKTLSQIATDANIDPKVILDAAVKATTAKINQRVKVGNIKQDQADKLIAFLPTEYLKMMNTVNPLTNGRPNMKDPKPTATPVGPATPSL